ncbi:MAG: sulfurtransferase TusA family protein [Planctomycetota bacterium]
MAAELRPAATCDGGDLDCGSGLLLIIRSAMQSIAGGEVLEVRSRESSVREDLPAWCRMVGHALLLDHPGDQRYHHFFIRKKGGDEQFAGDLEEARAFAWKVRVRWTGGMQAKAFARNHAFVIGQPASFDTEDPAPSAVEVLLASVAGCLVVGYQWRLSRAGVEVQNLEMAVRARADNILVFLGVEDSGHPGLALIEGSIYVEADAEDELLDELWQETVRRSPVVNSLTRAVSVQIEVKKQ